MLEIIQFDDNGLYGLRNMWTGIMLSNDGKWREFKSPQDAMKYAEKITEDLNKILRELGHR